VNPRFDHLENNQARMTELAVGQQQSTFSIAGSRANRTEAAESHSHTVPLRVAGMAR
jgi:hypothetical protein